MTSVVWVTGASSGIGAAFADVAATSGARVIGISRRAHARAEHLAADLSDPTTWPGVERHFAETLSEADASGAVLLHCAASTEASGPFASSDSDEYTRAVLLNSAAGQVLGRAFLVAADRSAVPATLLMCSSPAASNPRAGLSHYCAGKAAIDMWTRTIGAELGEQCDARILCVVPHATDTPMVRALIDTPESDIPLSSLFRKAAANGMLASVDQVAAEIWAAIGQRAPQAAVVHVGATGVAAEGDRP
jgi:benzil reductase ((S)-benzoin forming)